LLHRNSTPAQSSLSGRGRLRPERVAAFMLAVAIRNPPLRAADKMPAIVNASKLMVLPPFSLKRCCVSSPWFAWASLAGTQ
jgi:hypothetical protein